MATRQQHAKKISFDYLNSNGKWNISKIARDTGTSRTTVYKYFKHLLTL